MTLNEKNIGDIVKIKENGVYVDYIVVQKGKPSNLYDGSCDGVWLSRNQTISYSIYNDTQTLNKISDAAKSNDYENSYAHQWLNRNFLNTIDEKIRAIIKNVKIPFKKGNGETSLGVYSRNDGLLCKIFLPSILEIKTLPLHFKSGISVSNFEDGISLSSSYPEYDNYNNILGSSFAILTRTPYNNSYSFYSLWSDGEVTVQNALYQRTVNDGTVLGILLPHFIMPFNAIVDENDYVTGELKNGRILADKSVGDIVKIRIAGGFANYIVVQKGKPSYKYDETCSGVWLLSEKAYYTQTWNDKDSSGTPTGIVYYNDYEKSDCHIRLNSSSIGYYYANIDEKVKEYIKTVKIPYVKGTSNVGMLCIGVSGLSCKTFLLSARETGVDNLRSYNDGDCLEYFISENTDDGNAKRIMKNGRGTNGAAIFWWLRTPETRITKGSDNKIYYQGTDAWAIDADGTQKYRDGSNGFAINTVGGIRPAIILSYETPINEQDVLVEEIHYVKKPSLEGTTFNYNGNIISAPLKETDYTYSSVSGTLSGVAVGKYKINISLKDPETTMWEDGTTDDIILEWEIKPVTIAKPTVTPLSLEYNGSNQSVTISEYNSALVVKTGTETAKSAGIYNVIFALKDPSSSAWDNGDGTTTTDDIIIEWEITKKICKIPALKTTEFTYNGYYCVPPLDENYNSILMNCTGVTSAYNAGEYNVVVSLRDTTSTEWEDGTTENKTLNWKINKRIDKLGFPTISPTEFIFNNVRQAPLVTWGTNSNSNLISISGTTSAITACVDEPYKIIFSLKQNNNNITYVWEDDTTDDYILTWCINKAILPLPTIEKDTFEYNGKNITANVSSYDTNLVTRTGTISVANAKVGEYSVYYSLRDNASSEWEDGTIEDKKIIWSNK